MQKTGLVLLIFFFCTNAWADQEFSVLLKNLKQQDVLAKNIENKQNDGFVQQTKNKKKYYQPDIDDKTLGQLSNFIINKKSASTKKFDFEIERQQIFVSEFIHRYYMNKYGKSIGDNTTKVFLEDIPSAEGRKTYETVLKIYSGNYKDRNLYFRIAKGDEKKALEIEKKINVLRDTYSNLCKKDRALVYSEDAISINEQIEKLTNYKGQRALYYCSDLIGLFHKTKNIDYLKKYNTAMLQILKDDQVDYDYLYETFDTINHDFISEFLKFIQANVIDDFLLSKEQVRFIAEDIVNKHEMIFDFSNAYYTEDNGQPDIDSQLEGAQALMFISIWLRKYGLDSLNETVINKFYNTRILEIINSFPDNYDGIKQYKEFLVKQKSEIKKYQGNKTRN